MKSASIRERVEVFMQLYRVVPSTLQIPILAFCGLISRHRFCVESKIKKIIRKIKKLIGTGNSITNPRLTRRV